VLHLCSLRQNTDSFGLTPAEFQVVVELLMGHDDTEIAQHLALTERSVAQQLVDVFDKLRVCDRFELALALAHRGF
jgi:DNA-binding NarL/FixJ family response regulator